MTKMTEMIDSLALAYGCQKTTAKHTLHAVYKEIADAIVNTGYLRIRGVGVFNVVDCAERVMRNPNTNQKVIVPPIKRVRFRPSETIKKRINP